MAEKPKVGTKISCKGHLEAVHMDVKEETVSFGLRVQGGDLGPSWRVGGKLLNCKVRLTFEVLEEPVTVTRK